MTIWELQIQSKEHYPVTGSPSIHKKEIYARITVLYADILRELLKKNKPKSYTSDKYVSDMWLMIMSGYLRILDIEGVIWNNKMYKYGIVIRNCNTTQEVVIAMMMTHLMKGTGNTKEVISMINLLFWMKHRLQLDYKFQDIIESPKNKNK